MCRLANLMKFKSHTINRLKAIAASVALVGACAVPLQATVSNLTAGKWTISFDDASKKATFIKDGADTLLRDVSVRFRYGTQVIDASTYGSASVETSTFADATGHGRKFTIHYTGGSVPVVVDQEFYVMAGADYFLTDVALSLPSHEVMQSNYICPVYTTARNVFLPKDGNNRFLTVPFDNDGFITYGSFPLSRPASTTSMSSGRYARDSISFEVTSVFNGETQRGLVIGSVDHDNWKSAVRLTGSPLIQAAITRLECFSGVTHSATRDEHDGVLMPHGAVRGSQVKSARMLVGLFDDWRTGLETFGEVNAKIAPKAKYSGPAPFGWNSWGGMAQHVNYEGALSVSDFVKKNIQDKGHFGADGVVYIDLDSYWGNLNWDQLKDFCDHCRANGQIPGIYWTPWTYWLGSPEREMEGHNGYVYGQALLRQNGKQTGNMDPTSPATRSLINYYMDRFKALGIKYIKLDFLCSGIQEADGWYDKNVTTGVQAFNQGMKYLRERAGDDMFINESISPLFPACYAQSRRVSCDAWGEMWHTSYMMNSLSFGWWLDRVYSFNDPDHLVMGSLSEAENISRMTTGAVTGYFMLGDNLSTAGNYVGTATSQAKAAKFATYEKVNDVVRLGRSFRPAYGHKLYGRNHSVDLFYLETEDSWYVAQFNYEQGDKDQMLVDLSKLGINAADIDVSQSYECWTSGAVTISNGQLVFSSPNNMARLFRLRKK